jgi:hypothetical protein
MKALYCKLIQLFKLRTFGAVLKDRTKTIQSIYSCNSAAFRLRAVAYPHEVLLLDNSTTEVVKRCLNRDSFKFDVRRGLLKFNPAQYWMTVSTGTNIITYVSVGPFQRVL